MSALPDLPALVSSPADDATPPEQPLGEPPPDGVSLEELMEQYADDPEAAEGGKRESQASEIVKFVLARCELVHDENTDVYAIDKRTREVRPIERRAFKNWLQAEFYEATEKAIRTQSYSEAIQTLGGLGRHKGELVQVHIRCAAIDGAYLIDLAEPGNSDSAQVPADGPVRPPCTSAQSR